MLEAVAEHVLFLQALRARPTAAAAAEALGVFAPLANRLGVWSIKADLEDLAFKVYSSLDLSCNFSWTHDVHALF